MKLILVAKERTDLPGGENLFMINLIKGLSETGFDFKICNTGKPPRLHSFFDKTLEYSRVQSLFDVYGKVRKIKDYDIMHFLNASYCFTGLPKKGVKIATSHILGNSHFKFYKPHGIKEKTLESLFRQYSNAIDRMALNNMDCVVTSSSYHAKDIHETYNVPNSKINVIHPGVDISQIMRSPKVDLKSVYGCDNVLVYSSRISGFRKGLQYLINAVDENASYKVLVMGCGPDDKYFRRMIKEKGLESKIIFLGNLDMRQKTIIQKSADATVIPSVSESFCMVFAESLACGVPVLAFDLPFWESLYPGAGLFVKRDSLKEGIPKILNDTKLRKKIIENGNTLVKNYDVKKTVSDYIKLYESFG